MIKRLLTLVVAVLLTLAVGVAPATAAASTGDPAGDQTRLTYWSKATTTLRNMSDLRGVRLWKDAGTRRLVVRIRTAEVAGHSSSRWHDLRAVGTVGSTRVTFQARQEASGHWYRTVYAGSGRELCFDRQRLSVNYADNYVQMSIPISCLPSGRSFTGVRASSYSAIFSSGGLGPVGKDTSALVAVRVR
ncbi:hypothetical protein ASE01_03960 [Nocardioides sp. Root190]|uniref:hypothetical protein n=1 Tax=Nocardioides sp. Root190 TaxID=1736488 RepID=UPI0006F40E42|nr:hypothetical protein [Nocardioides sp. Root190]KRB78430.1 hypothetical protein ASE01_03960 [Nocardioides sp. Root190]